MYLHGIFICLTFIVALASSAVVKAYTDDMVALVQIFRHGQRYPTSLYTNDPHINNTMWSLGFGQLTSEGKRMHYSLGEFTRQRYTSWLPKYYGSGWFKAQTTDIDRTHMSCQSNLAGLFRPQQNETWNSDIAWQPIPVHPINETVLSPMPDCSIYTTELANILINDPLYAAINTELAELYTYIANKTGSRINSVQSVYSIYDVLHIEEQLGLKLPNWTVSVYPEPMKSITAYAFRAFTYTTEMKRLAAGSWLNTIYNYFVKMFANRSSSQKYQMWSAHDMNIAAILNTLGAFVPHYPAFASTLYFELRNNSGKAIINIWHKDDDLKIFEPIVIKGCEFNCPLDSFPTLLADYIIDSETWTTECKSTVLTSSDVTSDSEVALAIEQLEHMIKTKELVKPKGHLF